MLTKKISTLLASLFIASTSFAGWETIYCESPEFLGLKIINYDNRPNKYNCEEIQSTFEKAMRDVQAVSPIPLYGPLLSVMNLGTERGGTFDWAKSGLDASFPKLEMFDVSVAIFYHEMGHQIFYRYLQQKIQELVVIDKEVLAYRAYAQQCLFSPPEKECAASTAPIDLDRAAKNLSKDFKDLVITQGGYDELFSDVVASLAANDKDVTYNAIIKFTGSATSPYLIGRSFSKNEEDLVYGRAPHSLFSSLRKDIWDQWIEPRLNDKPALLNELAELFVTDMIANLESDRQKDPLARATDQIARVKLMLQLN